MNEQTGTKAGDASPLASARARASRLVLTRAALDEQLAVLNTRIDDEIRGLDERTALSLHDEVKRLEDLIRDLYLRIDTFMTEVGRIDQMAEALEVRLAEAVELRSQDRASERSDARHLAALEERLAALEGHAPLAT